MVAQSVFALAIPAIDLFMRILLFTVLNCIACDKHRRELIELAKNLNVSLNVYNIDDPRYLNVALKAMQLYGVKKTPSIILLNEENKMIASVQGVANSLERLTKKIDEERNSS